MSKAKYIFEERISQEKQIHEELFRKEMNNLNEKLRSEKYNIETMILKTGLGDAYHDLIDSKDELNSKYQSRYNKTYHSIDVELYKLNKKIDGKSRMVNYKYNDIKDKLKNKVFQEVL